MRKSNTFAKPTATVLSCLCQTGDTWVQLHILAHLLGTNTSKTHSSEWQKEGISSVVDRNWCKKPSACKVCVHSSNILAFLRNFLTYFYKASNEFLVSSNLFSIFFRTHKGHRCAGLGCALVVKSVGFKFLYSTWRKVIVLVNCIQPWASKRARSSLPLFTGNAHRRCFLLPLYRLELLIIF